MPSFGETLLGLDRIYRHFPTMTFHMPILWQFPIYSNPQEETRRKK